MTSYRTFKAVDRKNPSRTKGIEWEYFKFLRKKYRDIVKKIQELIRSYGGRPLSPGEIGDLLSKTGMVVNETLFDEEQTRIDQFIQKAVMVGKTRATQFLKAAGVKGILGITPPDKSIIEILSERGKSAIKDIGADIEKRLRITMTDAVMRGKGMNDIAGEIASEIKTSFSRAKVIARTEVMYAYNTAAKEEYKRYNVEKVEWLTAADDRRCPQCAALDGKVFDIDKAPDCPLHPNCRCVLLPVVEKEMMISIPILEVV